MSVAAAWSIMLGSFVLAGPSPADSTEVRARLDAAVAARWQALSVTPVGPADDATFLRRAWLDLAGRVPPALKARDFLADSDPNKRAKLVETLLASDEFADFWGRCWTQALTGLRVVKQESYDLRVLHQYLKESFKANKPYGQIVTELICGEGLSEASGPVTFLLRYQAKPTDLAGAVGKQFLGVTLQCAQCHDHPFARWKKDDFWGTAAFFGRLRLLEAQEEEENYRAVLETRHGELMIPDPAAKAEEGKGEEAKPAKKKVAPRLLGRSTEPIQGKRRPALAAWITARDNPFFARNLVNRVWSQLFGASLVNGLDRPVSPGDGQHPQVLDLLAEDFTASGHDVQRLLRIILLSRAYQLSAGANQPSAEESLKSRRNLACFPVRSLSVDQLYQAIVQATGHRGEEPEAQKQAAEKDEDDDADTPVDQLGERALTVQRSLALLNGDYVHKAVQAGAKAAKAVNGQHSGPTHVEWLFLATLSRRPTAEESAAMLQLLKDSKGKGGLEDILWVLLNSVELTTNH